MLHLPSFKNVFMAVYQCQAFDLISALFASLHSIKCMLPHFEVSVKSDKYEADFLEWDGITQRLFRGSIHVTCVTAPSYSFFLVKLGKRQGDMGDKYNIPR